MRRISFLTLNILLIMFIIHVLDIPAMASLDIASTA